MDYSKWPKKFPWVMTVSDKGQYVYVKPGLKLAAKVAGRPRVYENAAEKQQAYRRRKADKPLVKSPVETYFVYDSEREAVKIGRSKHLAQRVKGLGRAAQFIGSINGDWEHKYHLQFKRDRLSGEWFTLSPALSVFLREQFKWALREVTDSSKAA
jgi:hypothetical protein